MNSIIDIIEDIQNIIIEKENTIIQEIIKEQDKVNLELIDTVIVHKYKTFPLDLSKLIYGYLNCKDCKNCCTICTINCFYECGREKRDVCCKYENMSIRNRYKIYNDSDSETVDLEPIINSLIFP